MATTEEARAVRDAKLDELHERLAGAVERLVTGDDWRRALEFAARFRSRSFGNTLLIWVQHLDAFEQGRVPNPEPSYVAGYKQWQALGRQVAGDGDLRPATRPEERGEVRRIEDGVDCRERIAAGLLREAGHAGGQQRLGHSLTLRAGPARQCPRPRLHAATVAGFCPQREGLGPEFTRIAQAEAYQSAPNGSSGGAESVTAPPSASAANPPVAATTAFASRYRSRSAPGPESATWTS